MYDLLIFYDRKNNNLSKTFFEVSILSIIVQHHTSVYNIFNSNNNKCDYNRKYYNKKYPDNKFIEQINSNIFRTMSYETLDVLEL